MARLPFTFYIMRTVGTAMALSLCLLSACTSRTIQIPTLPPSDEGRHDDPARDARMRLLAEAHRAFVQARYPTAILFFRRFLEHSPDSPHLAEARWWLGRAHEQVGDFGAAMAQYRVVASGELSQQINGALYEGHALRRLDELRRLHADLNGSTRQVALHIRANNLPPMPGLRLWLQELSQDGVTSLVVEAIQTQPSSHALFNSERVKALVAEAHDLGLLVWVALDVHQPQGLDLKPEWLNGTGHGRANEGTAMSRPDVTHPDYQTSLEEVVRALARSGCDGLFLPARSLPGFAGEWSGESWRIFSLSFGLSPEQDSVIDLSAPASERTVTYWRWVGWKALSYAKLVARLRAVLRETNPTATVLVEVHQATLGTPLAGLEHYGEDLVELVQRSGGAILVRREGTGGEALFKKLGQQLGTMERRWMGVSTTIARPIADLKKALFDAPEFQGWNLLIMVESASAVP